MLFNSKTFLVFFVVVYAAYWLLRDVRRQNRLLLAASYVFYSAWDVRFLPLLMASTAADYWFGLKIAATESPTARKRYLVLSLAVNLAVLGFFKYLDFGIQSAAAVLTAVGLAPDWPTLNIILPVGISFYTFQSISYIIDVYRRETPPVRSLFDYALYVTYFPQLVAGPIERSGNLLPQLRQGRSFCWEDVRIGLSWTLLGFFKKVVIADTLAPMVNQAFDRPHEVSGITSLVAVVGFAVQIYGDFAGYSLIARGVSRLLGIGLMENFRAPYLARGPREFWKRWHISLSEWLRQYLYISLGGNRCGRYRTYFNLFVTMLLGGLWHGARWNFVLWGAYHGLWLSLSHAWSGRRAKRGAPSFAVALVQWGLTFALTLFGWLLFRVADVGQLGDVLHNIAFNFTWSAEVTAYLVPTATALAVLLAYHLWQEYSQDVLVLMHAHGDLQWAVHTFLAVTCLVVGFRGNPFVYFQF